MVVVEIEVAFCFDRPVVPIPKIESPNGIWNWVQVEVELYWDGKVMELELELTIC